MTNIEERIAELTAHRACGNQEHEPLNGKLAGYCVVCQVPWPCEFAKPRSFWEQNTSENRAIAELAKPSAAQPNAEPSHREL